MSGTISTRWYFSDWMSDPGVRASSLAARGLWIDLLALAGQNCGRDHGYVLIAGRVPTTREIARYIGSTHEEVETLTEELARNQVFSRDRRGAIYCRRMVRAEKNRGNGRLGGNPNLLKQKENPNPVKPGFKALIPEPEPEQKQKQKQEQEVAAVSRYAFEAGVIRLNQTDLDKWKRAFEHIGVEAELWSLAGYDKLTPENWFVVVPKILAKANREAKEASERSRASAAANGHAARPSQAELNKIWVMPSGLQRQWPKDFPPGTPRPPPYFDDGTGL